VLLEETMLARGKLPGVFASVQAGAYDEHPANAWKYEAKLDREDLMTGPRKDNRPEAMLMH
jgi:hypothetical protein